MMLIHSFNPADGSSFEAQDSRREEDANFYFELGVVQRGDENLDIGFSYQQSDNFKANGIEADDRNVFYLSVLTSF